MGSGFRWKRLKMSNVNPVGPEKTLKILEKAIENISQAITKSKIEKEKCSQDWAAEGG